ncbi:Hypothetical protein GbCGDNIH4_7022 [Granulibacter bethesdensis CGDNIH4]|nr:Hypothetical protein GbCGDNIH4_7022 [Granulibacter bethesdensis CGDNIH4]
MIDDVGFKISERSAKARIFLALFYRHMIVCQLYVVEHCFFSAGKVLWYDAAKLIASP